MDNGVVAVIVTYNRKVLLKECVNALLKQTYPVDHIVIIDNHSTDGTGDYIQSDLKSELINYEYMEQNIGGAGGFNQGIKEAAKYTSEYIWLMDDDTIPTSDALKKMMDAAEKVGFEFGFLASNVLWKDGTPCLMNIPKVHEDWIYQTQYLKSNLVRLESASFVSLLVSKKAVMECGLPIKEFFIWGDDVEYTKRISKKFINYFCGDSVVVHKMKFNERTDIYTDSGTRLKRYEYMIRNRGKDIQDKGVYEKLKYLLRGMVLSLSLLIKGTDHRFERAKVVFVGTIKGLIFNPAIEYINVLE